jgi:hypothetical protein
MIQYDIHVKKKDLLDLLFPAIDNKAPSEISVTRNGDIIVTTKYDDGKDKVILQESEYSPGGAVVAPTTEKPTENLDLKVHGNSGYIKVGDVTVPVCSIEGDIDFKPQKYKSSIKISDLNASVNPDKVETWMVTNQKEMDILGFFPIDDHEDAASDELVFMSREEWLHAWEKNAIMVVPRAIEKFVKILIRSYENTVKNS